MAVNDTAAPSALAVGVSARRARLVSAARVFLIRAAIVAGVLLGWQYVPEIDWLRERSPVFDSFFVSSPSQVFQRLSDMMLAQNGQPSIWPYVGETLQATFVGVLVGTTAGGTMGLIFSNSPGISRVMSPFVTLLNAVPRVALIPIFVIIAGPTIMSSILTSIAVVFFLVFYNAFSGGTSVPVPALQNARLLGATSLEVMRQVRLPYVLVWTFASLPNAISFGLVAVVTAEILTGTVGMGRLLQLSISTVDSTLTFAVVVVLTISGVTIVTLSEVAKRRILHWWAPSASTFD